MNGPIVAPEKGAFERGIVSYIHHNPGPLLGPPNKTKMLYPSSREHQPDVSYNFRVIIKKKIEANINLEVNSFLSSLAFPWILPFFSWFNLFIVHRYCDAVVVVLNVPLVPDEPANV